MRKIIKKGNIVIVIFDDGNTVQAPADEVDMNFLQEGSDEEVFKLLCPVDAELLEKKQKTEAIVLGVENSGILKKKGDSIYWEGVSPYSLPPTLIERILQAEFEKNNVLIETYKNFWSLMSINPNEECRKNLFWFLDKWGMRIARCGFFVGYRNVDKTDEEGVFTDAYTHTFKIKIGEMVTQARELCDCDSNVSCSRGLHVGGTTWLNQNYYGEQGIVVLVNPADTIAVPHADDYGKLRTTAYLPIALARFNIDRKVIPIDVEDGFDCSYVSKVIYEGLMGTKEDSPYKIQIPVIEGFDKNRVYDNLLSIAFDCVVKRTV